MLSDFADRVAKDAQVLGKWAKNARVTIEVVGAAVAPLSGAVVQQTQLTPPMPVEEISQELKLDEQKDWAHYDLQQREQASSRVVGERGIPAPLQEGSSATPSAKETRSQPQRKAKRTRER